MKKNTENTKPYKGYTGTIEVSIEDGCLHGRILFIDDIITYEGKTVANILKSFHKSVDRYLAYCLKTGKPANKPYSGSFNVRVGQDLHKKAVEEAHYRNTNLNDFVIQSIKLNIDQHSVVKVEHTHNHKITLADSELPSNMLATMEKPNSWERAIETRH